jgi:hypothetical protein
MIGLIPLAVAAIGAGYAALVLRSGRQIIRITCELGRKTVLDDDPRSRVDTRVLEIIARFDERGASQPSLRSGCG